MDSRFFDRLFYTGIFHIPTQWHVCDRAGILLLDELGNWKGDHTRASGERIVLLKIKIEGFIEAV